MKKHEFIKAIPQEWQTKLGATRFKISLIKAKDIKEVRLLKALLEFKVRDIYQNPHLQSKEASVQYLKDCVLMHILGQSDLNNSIIYKPKTIVTFQNIMENAIEQRKLDYSEREGLLSKQGVDTKIKRDTTLIAYFSIQKHIDSFFGENYDINKLNFKIAKEFAGKINKSYVAHLKSIFKRASNENPNIVNWWEKLETSVEDRFGNINKSKDFFTFDEIYNILNTLDEEQGLMFQTLLYTGMRYDEIISLKKGNIKNNSFYFKDSKAYFNKVVPIHPNILNKIYAKLENIGNDEYLFFPATQSFKRNTNHIRQKINNVLNELSKKTLHKTRATFITYLNYFRDDFSEIDIKSFTHKLNGVDQEVYNKGVNVERLRKIIDSIDLQKLNEIESL
ncbi:hypothetical protein DF188_08505 [Aliarcobacter skirrowii]|uniref:Tyr recombinase domain-containing protein n=1 Tax=Aliarcobacter skirrowii TaxID=28200 RepID=A0A2U2BZ57_9BACT|nr:tyrosine-type recombinase/integrase [Aliarcobacter skirrowii]PWE20205.1 hypothetical protein DF188_08505 [Aliarcobacter skirrowii]